MKNPERLCKSVLLVLIAATLAFIWGNSLLTNDLSHRVSRRFQAFFGIKTASAGPVTSAALPFGGRPSPFGEGEGKSPAEEALAENPVPGFSATKTAPAVLAGIHASASLEEMTAPAVLAGTPTPASLEEMNAPEILTVSPAVGLLTEKTFPALSAEPPVPVALATTPVPVLPATTPSAGKASALLPLTYYPPSEEQILERNFRKTGHFLEFLLLGGEITLYLALCKRRLSDKILILSTAALFAPLTDETIQMILGRNAAIGDIWIDIGGFASGALVAGLIFGAVRHFTKAPATEENTPAENISADSAPGLVLSENTPAENISTEPAHASHENTQEKNAPAEPAPGGVPTKPAHGRGGKNA